ncbi:MAG: hypothetical protein ACFFC6_15890, partial [Promethearchaeota archaeon]
EILLSKEISKAIKNQINKNPEILEVIIPKNLESTPTSELIFKPILDTQTSLQESHSLSFEVNNLDSKDLPAFHRGVLIPLEVTNAEVSMKIEVNVKSKEEIPETIIDTTLKETIRQLGARITSLKKEKKTKAE